MSFLPRLCRSRFRNVRLKSTQREQPKLTGSQKLIPNKPKELSPIEKLDEVRKILAKRTEPEFHFDPSNTKLDLTKSNRVLYSQIKGEAKSRTDKRFTKASKKWESNLEQLARTQSKTRKQIQEEILGFIETASLSPETVHESVSIGDLVTLKEESLTFYLVVGLPDTLGSQSYSFVNDEGEIVFGSKSSIKLRFPMVVPQEYHGVLESLVQRETKYLDVAPVGVSDAKFSRSSESLPIGVKSKNQETKDTGSDTESTDFLVAQASSQLLTNTNVNTFLVPINARKLFGTALSKLAIHSNGEMFTMNHRLMWLHQILQYDENGDVLKSPRTISIFELLHLAFSYNLYFLENPSTSATPLNQMFSKYQPPRETGKYHVSKVLAFITILRKHQRLYNIDKHSAGFSPTSVTIIPRQNLEAVATAVAYFKKSQNMNKFVTYYLSVVGGKNDLEKPKFYDEIIAMLKDYIIGNFTNDYAAETCLVSIVRLVDEKQGSKIEYSYEYLRARAYQLLNDLEIAMDMKRFDSNILVNPVYWSRALKLPTAEVSMLSELGKEYFDYMNKWGNEKEEYSGLNDFHQYDRLSSIREDFGDIPVYCIDSPDAHEIDDGVSIHEDGENYVISTHVANPSSFIKPDSHLNEIAFTKGRTTYLPEQASLMLPQHISAIAGLGVDGKPTRSFAVQYKIEKKLLDEEETSEDGLKEIYSQVTSSISVKSVLAQNFPINYTYERVNQVLRNEDMVNAFKTNGSSGDTHFDNLYKMYKLSRKLNKFRLEVGQGMQFDVPRGIIKVKEAESDKQARFNKIANGYQIIPAHSSKCITVTNTGSQDRDSLSQLLVSELMVFANHSCARFARDNNVKVIYRTQDMKLHPNVKKELSKISQDKTEEELSKMFSVLTSAKTQVSPKKHQSIGLDSYTNVTSPLRRYTDILNHWKFEDYLLEQAGLGAEQSIPDHQLQFISDHLQSMETVNSWAQRFSTKFWEGIFLREYVQLLQADKIPIQDKINFRLLIKSNPKHGNFVRVDMLGFNNLNCKLKIGDTLKGMFSSETIKVGSVLEGDNLKITRVDFLEDEVIFEYNL